MLVEKEESDVEEEVLHFLETVDKKKLAELNVDSFTIFECTTKTYYYFFFLSQTNLCVEDGNKCRINMSECWRSCLSLHD